MAHIFSTDNCTLQIRLWLCMGLILLFSASPMAALTIQMDRQEVIQRSELIFTGAVTEIAPRWNDQGNMIVTDVTFRIDSTLYGTESRPEITLTFAGGQLLEEGQAVSGVPEFTLDETVLLMLESTTQPLLSPITGMSQGRFTSHPGRTGIGEVFTGEHADIPLTTRRGDPIRFTDFVAMIQQEIPQAKAQPLPDRSVPPDLQHLIITDLPAKEYDPTVRLPHRNIALPAEPDPQSFFRGHTSPPAPSSSGESSPSTSDDVQYQGSTERYSYQHRAKTVPISVDPLPTGGMLSLHDQFQMSYWNKYADIFRVVSPASPTWAWRNNVYEIAGFINNATMVTQFGQGWGSTTLAITWSRWDSTDFTIEADIALNPGYNWTVNDYSTYRSANLYNADRTLLHEIGHQWGLQHQWNALSVMNYAPKKYRAYTVLYMDDVRGVKAAFPSRRVNRSDQLIALFYANGHQNYDDSNVNTTSIVAGNDITVSDIVIENTGTSTIAPLIDWYLTPDINSWTDAIGLEQTTHSSLSPGNWFRTSRDLHIPSSVQGGDYYIGAYVRLDSDSVSDNDETWLDRRITVIEPSPTPVPTSTPEPTATTVPTVTVTPAESATPVTSATPVVSPTVTGSASPSPSATVSSTPTATSSATGTATASPSPSATGTATASPTATFSPTVTNTPTPRPLTRLSLNYDVHFNYFSGLANDFHVECFINSPVMPIYAGGIVFGDGTTGNWVEIASNIAPAGDGQWMFTADYVTDGFISYCQWLHYGFDFLVPREGYISGMVGWWTFNGIPLIPGYVPITGFWFDYLWYIHPDFWVWRLWNDSELIIHLISLEYAVYPGIVPLGDLWLSGLGAPGSDSPLYPEIQWKSITDLPPIFNVDSFFDVFLDVETEPMPGSSILVRGQQLELDEETGDFGYFWQEREYLPPPPTPTPVVTPEPPSGILNGIVLMERDVLPPDVSYSVPIQVELCAAGTSIASYEAMTDLDGMFSVAVQPGLYDVFIKGNHTLQAMVPGIYVTEGDSVDMPPVGPLPEGDADNDNAVISTDFFILRNTYNLGAGDDGFDSRADFNEDGVVTSADFFLMREHYNQGGMTCDESRELLSD